VAVTLLKMGYTTEQVKELTGAPWWRQTVPSGDPEFDHYTPTNVKLSPAAAAAIYNLWGQGADPKEFFDNWNKYSDYKVQPPAGLVFRNGQFLGRNYLGSWQ